jgi:hypothetical protein
MKSGLGRTWFRGGGELWKKLVEFLVGFTITDGIFHTQTCFCSSYSYKSRNDFPPLVADMPKKKKKSRKDFSNEPFTIP